MVWYRLTSTVTAPFRVIPGYRFVDGHEASEGTPSDVLPLARVFREGGRRETSGRLSRKRGREIMPECVGMGWYDGRDLLARDSVRVHVEEGAPDSCEVAGADGSNVDVIEGREGNTDGGQLA